MCRPYCWLRVGGGKEENKGDHESYIPPSILFFCCCCCENENEPCLAHVRRTPPFWRTASSCCALFPFRATCDDVCSPARLPLNQFDKETTPIKKKDGESCLCQSSSDCLLLRLCSALPFRNRIPWRELGEHCYRILSSIHTQVLTHHNSSELCLVADPQHERERDAAEVR